MGSLLLLQLKERKNKMTHMNLKTITEIGYPKNIVAEVLNLSTEDELKSITNDVAAMQIIVLQILTPREEYLMNLRYERKLNYNEMSEITGLSSENCRQIVYKALRKLKHPSCSKLLMNRYEYYRDCKEGFLEAREQEMRRSAYEEGFAAALKVCLTEEECRARAKFAAKDLLERKIEEVNFSSRAYKSLDAVGCWTISNVLALTREQILGLRGIGIASIRNVADTLRLMGLNGNTAWDDLVLEMDSSKQVCSSGRRIRVC